MDERIARCSHSLEGLLTERGFAGESAVWGRSLDLDTACRRWHTCGSTPE